MENIDWSSLKAVILNVDETLYNQRVYSNVALSLKNWYNL